MDEEDKNETTKSEEANLAKVADESAIFMGEHPDKNKIEELILIPEVADRIKTWIKEGIPKEEKSEILKLVPKNHKNFNLNAPKLNPEIQSNLKDDALKRDRYFYAYQNMIGSSLSLTALVLSMILNDEEEAIDREVILQCLSDAVKINSDLFRCWMIARKVYITPAFDKKIKTALDKAEPTEFLFGDNVKDIVSGVKAIERVGKDLKPFQPKKPTRGNNNSLNWKGSFVKKEVDQRNQNQNQKSYYTSRNFSRGGYKKQFQRDYSQSQPMQKKKDQQW